MLTLLLIAIVVLVIAAAVIVSRQPPSFHIERSVRIAAPAERIFPHVNASRAWESWSPWQKHDPNAVFSYEGPAAGVGAMTRFAGRKSGTGTSTIVESLPARLIRFRLEMVKPFKSASNAAFAFVPAGDETVVTWSLSGPLNLPAKIMRLFINCDDLCGKAFSQGLDDLKRCVESGTQSAQVTEPALK